MIKHLLSDDTQKLYSQPKKELDYPHFNIPKSNMMHEIDILYLPSDHGFKYLLLCIDVHNSLCGGYPLKNMMINNICNGLDTIYSSSKYLKKPNFILCDNQFNNVYFKKWCNNHHISFRFSEPYNHRQVAHINSLCKTLGKWIFQLETNEEVKTGKQHTEWRKYVEKLIPLINEYRVKNNNLDEHFNRKKMIVNDNIIVNKNNNDLLYPNEKVRIKLEKNEHTDNFGKKLIGNRATDINWSVRIYTIISPVFTPSNPIMYRIKDDMNRELKCLFNRERLLRV